MAGLGNLNNYLEKHPVEPVGADRVLPPLIERFDPERHASDASPEAMRERILDEIAQRWTSPGEIDGDSDLTVEALHARAIRGVDFVDANRTGTDGEPEPIPLRIIVDRVVNRLQSLSADTVDPNALYLVAIGCRLHTVQLDDTELRAGLALLACRIAGDVSLNGARVSGSVSLYEASVIGGVWLDDAGVDGDVSLYEARVSGGVFLNGASVGGSVWLHRASVGGGVRLEWANVGGGARLEWANVGGDVWLHQASVGGSVRLHRVSIGGGVWLIETTAGRSVSLNEASVGGDVSLYGASISGDVSLNEASIGSGVDASNASFGRKIEMHALLLSGGGATGTASLQSASWHETSKDSARFARRPPAGLFQAIGRMWSRTRLASIESRPAPRNWDWFKEQCRAVKAVVDSTFDRLAWTAALRSHRTDAHWGKVRAFGELAILSRASNTALIGVPVLAALWPTLRDLVQWVVQRQGQLAQSPLGISAGVPTPTRTPHQAYLDANLPWIWGALFFAALLAVIGRVLYQAHCPQLIKEHSREDLITKRKDEFQRLRESDAAAQASAGPQGLPDEAKVHLSILEDSLKLVQEAGTDAQLSAFRHSNLVRVNGRTYWLPQAVDDFAYQPTEIDDPKVVAMKRCRERLSETHPERFKDEPQIEDKKVLTTPAWIPRTRREVIAVMAGADAEYDLEARRRLGYAYLSRWCYVLATVLIGIVLWFQGSIIFWEMGAGRTSGWESNLHRWLYWAGTHGLFDGLLVAMGLIMLWLLFDMVFGRDPLPHSDTFRWRIHRDLRKQLGKDHYRRK